MRYIHVIATLLSLAVSSSVLAANHPDLSELTPLLKRSIDSDEGSAHREEVSSQKGLQVRFRLVRSDDEAFRLMFSENRIDDIILQASPWPKGYDDANWTTYSHPLPGNLKPTDDRKAVETKLGKPAETHPRPWLDKEDKTLLLLGAFSPRQIGDRGSVGVCSTGEATTRHRNGPARIANDILFRMPPLTRQYQHAKRQRGDCSFVLWRASWMREIPKPEPLQARAVCGLMPVDWIFISQ